MSLPIEDVIESLRRLAPNLPPATLIAIENDLEGKQAELAAERGGAPKLKHQLACVLLDPEHRLDGLPEFAALIVQIPENDDTGAIIPRLHQAAYAQRAAAKRKVKPLTNLVEVAANAKRRFLKEAGIGALKTREPVRVLVTDGVVPHA